MRNFTETQQQLTNSCNQISGYTELMSQIKVVSGLIVGVDCSNNQQSITTN
ncbi:MAG: hypothetical protein NHB32_09170 [Fischerella sp. CENA71]|nr:hypothetical protein [Fischerella sp. CENA71]